MILTCLPVEARVLVGMLTDPNVLALCDDVESADFVDMRHVVLFYGIRDAQAANGNVDVDSVVDAIQQRALETGAVGMAEAVGYKFIRDLVTNAPAGGLRTIRRDTAQLRRDREFRERVYESNASASRGSR